MDEKPEQIRDYSKVTYNDILKVSLKDPLVRMCVSHIQAGTVSQEKGIMMLVIALLDEKEITNTRIESLESRNGLLEFERAINASIK